MRRTVLALLLGGAATVAGLALAASASVGSDLRAARASLAAARDRAEALDLDAARREIDRAEARIRSARGRLRGLPLRVAAALPYAGRSVRAADALATAADRVVAGARAALGGADLLPDEDAFRLAGGRLPDVDWEALARSAERAEDRFSEAGDIARRAPASLVLGEIARARRELLVQAEEIRRAAERLALGARVAAGMLGGRGPRLHLVVVQNGAEARRTGGVVDALVLLAARDGRVALERLQPDEALLAPPGAAEEADRINATPDFPTAAANMAALYRRSWGRAVDAVIAVDAVALGRLLEITGPVVVDGQRVDAATVVRYLSRDVYARYPEQRRQTVFLARLSDAVWSRLLGGGFSIRSLVEHIGAAAREKHLLVWSGEVREQEALDRLGLAGAFRPARPGTFLAVVGNNLGDDKLDALASRTIHYRVRLDETGRAAGALEVTLRNGARLAVLPEAVLNENRAGILRSGIGVWGIGGEARRFPLAAPPGATAQRALAFSIEGAADLSGAAGTYRLRVFRQPSLRPDRVTLEVTVPHGYRIVGANRGLRVRAGVAVWDGWLVRDLDLRVRFRRS